MTPKDAPNSRTHQQLIASYRPDIRRIFTLSRETAVGVAHSAADAPGAYLVGLLREEVDSGSATSSTPWLANQWTGHTSLARAQAALLLRILRDNPGLRLDTKAELMPQTTEETHAWLSALKVELDAPDRGRIYGRLGANAEQSARVAAQVFAEELLSSAFYDTLAEAAGLPLSHLFEDVDEHPRSVVRDAYHAWFAGLMYRTAEMGFTHKELAAALGVNQSRVGALIDSGASLVRGAEGDPKPSELPTDDTTEDVGILHTGNQASGTARTQEEPEDGRNSQDNLHPDIRQVTVAIHLRSGGRPTEFHFTSEAMIRRVMKDLQHWLH